MQLRNKIKLLGAFFICSLYTVNAYANTEVGVYNSKDMLYSKYEMDTILNFLSHPKNINVLSSWDGKSIEDLDFIEWESVEDIHYIKNIELSSKELFGDIEIKNFKSLESIDLSDNYIKSFAVDDVPELENIDLHNNILYSFKSDEEVSNIDLRDNLLFSQNISYNENSNLQLDGNYINDYNRITYNITYDDIDEYAYIDISVGEKKAIETSNNVSKRWVKYWKNHKNDFVFSDDLIEVIKAINFNNEILGLRVPIRDNKHIYTVYLDNEDVSNKVVFEVNAKQKDVAPELEEGSHIYDEVVLVVEENKPIINKQVNMFSNNTSVVKNDIEKDRLENDKNKHNYRIIDTTDLFRTSKNLLDYEADFIVNQEKIKVDDNTLLIENDEKLENTEIFEVIETIQVTKDFSNKSIRYIVIGIVILLFSIAFFIRKINSKGR